MNVVVLLPALASFLAPAVADGALCFEGTCLFGWAWSTLALTFASVWVVRRWQMGDDGGLGRLVPAVASSGAAAAAAALLPRVTGVASPTRAAADRSLATGLADAGLALRAPPTTDMAADLACRSLLPPRPSRPTGTPAESEPSDAPPGQTPPV